MEPRSPSRIRSSSLLRRLAVFTGGFTYDAAEDVAGADPDTLQSLLDKSLLRKREAAAEARYWMLETIREYAIERLEESREADDVRRRHADHFLALAEEAESHARLTDAFWLDRLDREADNLRGALDWLEDSKETQLVLRLVGALDDFWVTKGHVAEEPARRGRAGRRRVSDRSAREGVERCG